MTDLDHLMQQNLARVFNERDALVRMQAIRELYAQDAVLYEPHAAVTGHAAISEAVTALLCSRTHQRPEQQLFVPLAYS